MDDFFEKQMTNSKLLINSGERDRILFINSMRQKIKKLREQIIIEFAT